MRYERLIVDLVGWRHSEVHPILMDKLDPIAVDAIEAVIDTLKPNEAFAVRSRYGESQLTFMEIASRLNRKSADTGRRLYENGLRRLRHSSRLNAICSGTGVSKSELSRWWRL